MSIVGYDDAEPLATTSVPGLTTVALPHREMGERAIELLCRDLARGASTTQEETIMVEWPVLLRGSVAALLYGVRCSAPETAPRLK